MASDNSTKKRYVVEVTIEADGPGQASNEVADRLDSLEDISTIGTSMRIRNEDGTKNEVTNDQ